MTIATQNELETDVEVRPDGQARVVLRGRLNAQTVVGCWSLLEQGIARERKSKHSKWMSAASASATPRV